MDLASAKAFLAQHQPMPPDEEAPEELIDEFAAVLECIDEHPDPEMIPFLLSVFGVSNRLGIYEHVYSILSGFAADQLLPHLWSALKSAYPERRFRAALLMWELLALSDKVLPVSDELERDLIKMVYDDSCEVWRVVVDNILPFIASDRVLDALHKAVEREKQRLELVQRAAEMHKHKHSVR